MPETLRTTNQVHQADGPSRDRPVEIALGGTSGLRAQLVRLAILPALSTALIGAGVAVYLYRVDIGSEPSWMPVVVLGSAAMFLALVVFLAVHTAGRTETELGRRVAAVRLSVIEIHYRTWQALDEVQRALPSDRRWAAPMPNPAQQPMDAAETVGALAADVRLLRQAADALAAHAAQGLPADLPGRSPRSGPESGPVPIESASMHSRVGIFVNLARRLQSLVHREIEQLDELENQVEDPDLLKGLFSVDHLATRIRRHAENLAVLGGAASRRQWSRPVNVYEALRSAVAEVEQYARVKLVRPIDGTLKGHAVADIIHLVAELVENATGFSAPQTQVMIRVQRVRNGLAVEVEDRGLGMEQEERDRYNKMLTAPGEVDLDELLSDGRIGLYVVSALARRHGLTVQLQSNIFGGTQAILVISEELLGDTADTDAPKGIETMSQEQVPALPSIQMTGPISDDAGRHRRAQPVVGNGQSAPPQPRPNYSPAPVYAPSPVASSPNGQQTIEMGAVTDHSGAMLLPEEFAGRGAGPVSDAPNRPALPKRNKQSHLAPQLREVPRTEARGSEAGHDPSLMKTFQQGQDRADVKEAAPQIPNPDSPFSPYRSEEA